MNQTPDNMYEYWSSLAMTIAFALVVLSAIYYLGYVIISASIKNRSSKYKFIQKREIAAMWHASLGFVIAIALVLNILLLHERDFGHLFIFFLKAGLPIGVAITIGYGIKTYLNVYYPFTIERKLADIRFKERKNPKTGKPMRLLNEEEEDEYQTEEMIKQEAELRYDFDVWLDESTGDTIIETFHGSTNRICPSCNFRTLKLVKEEVDSGTNMNTLHYSCPHCGHKEHEEETYVTI